MDKIIQTLILQNTSKTAGRASENTAGCPENQNNAPFAYKRVSLTVSKSTRDIGFPRKPTLSDHLREKESIQNSRALHSATGGHFLATSSCMASGIHWQYAASRSGTKQRGGRRRLWESGTGAELLGRGGPAGCRRAQGLGREES